jgi:dimethylamine/trimethylamine dehydrogenase
VLLVTSRLPEEQLFLELRERRAAGHHGSAGLVRAVGDAHAPGTIAAAVWDGRRFAEELDGADGAALFRRSIARVGGAGPSRT